MKISVKQGATSVTVNVFIQDSSSTVGAGKAGLAFNTASLTAYYMRPRVAATAITLATLAAVTSAYSSGGFKEIDSTNAIGWYRFDIPDACLANAERFVSIHFQGAANMAPLALEIALEASDNQDGVRLGLTALPNAAAEAAGGLYTRGTGAGQIRQDANGRIDANAKAWIDGTIPAVNVTGVPLVDDKYLLGTIYSTPATAGIQDINVKNMNNVAATSITTINANHGTTQPINFTGTGASALAKSDMVDVAGAAVSTSTAQLGVNVVNAGAVAWASGAITSSVFAANTGLVPVRTGTAQAGAATTITLDASASAVDNFYNNDLVFLTGGTGAGQARFISGYVGTTKVATVGTWATNPDNTSTFAVLPSDATQAPSAATIATAVWATSCTEPTAVVAASPTVLAAISWLNTLSRNKVTQTATAQVLKADDGSTTIATSTVSDDGTTATRGEFA